MSRGKLMSGMAGKVRHGEAWRGLARFGKARLGRHGRLGKVSLVWLWQVLARCVLAGMASQGAMSCVEVMRGKVCNKFKEDYQWYFNGRKEHGTR